MRRKFLPYHYHGSALCAVILLLIFVNQGVIAQDIPEQGISSRLTKNFVPTYKEYTFEDSTRSRSVNFSRFEDKKLIFFDNFLDNRHIWTHWTSTGDSILRECIGFKGNYICRGDQNHLVDAFTNMSEGKKVLYSFTPDERTKYSNNLKVPLAKDYVITFNPLSIRQVSKLPGTYYESYNEHTTRIQNKFSDKNFVIETNVETAIGSWGVVFGDRLSERPYYYFVIRPDQAWAFCAVYLQNKAKPVELESGTLSIPSAAVRNVKLQLKDNFAGGFEIEFKINDSFVGRSNITRLPLNSMDIGYRMDHNSIDGNNVLVIKDLSIYEDPVKTYLEEGVTLNGLWKGGLYSNGEKLYDVSIDFSESSDGTLSGRFNYRHVRFEDIRMTKTIRGLRMKNFANFEEITASERGVNNPVMRYSLLGMGNLELLDPDSIRLETYVTNNLHLYGNFDKALTFWSDDIRLGRVNKTTNLRRPEYDNIFEQGNAVIEIENIYFLPNKPDIAEDQSTRQSLDYLARTLQRYLAKYPDRIVLIRGHNDISRRQVLSLMRAFTIKSELIKRGVEGNLFPIGHGHSQRVTGVRGDPRNRRVEIEILDIDSSEYENENLRLKESASAYFINKLPDTYVINTDFSLNPGGEYYILLKNQATNDVFRWEVPNTAGGERQNLRIVRNYRIKEDAIVLEFWLDKVNVLTQSIHNYDSFGFEVKSGTMQIDNINIFAPE